MVLCGLGRKVGWSEPLPREGMGKAGVNLLRPAFSRAGQWHTTDFVYSVVVALPKFNEPHGFVTLGSVVDVRVT